MKTNTKPATAGTQNGNTKSIFHIKLNQTDVRNGMFIIPNYLR